MADTDFDAVSGSLNNNVIHFYDYENMTSITLSSGTQTYTAPYNGMLVIQLGSGEGTKPYIYIKNSSNIGIITIQSHGTWETATLPMKKGQQVIIEFTNYVSSYNALFIPQLT